MQRIEREQARKYAFDFRDAPLLKVQSGESVEIETYDASTGFFKSESDKAIPGKRPGFDRMPALANPIAGPIHVEGAERGDTLVVTIEDILVDSYSWIATGPRRGPLGESTRWPELSGDYTTKIFKHTAGPSGTTRDGTLHFSDRITWPITPFIGTLGVCPDREVTTSLDGQGEWGGNLDIRDVAPGNRIHLPVFHPGALFCMGDVHASQGDTEFSGTAAETKATTRVKLELIKGRKTPWMRIEKPGSIVAIHASRPLEVAVETATIMLMDWLITDFGFTPTDAYCLVSTCPDFRINVSRCARSASWNTSPEQKSPSATWACNVCRDGEGSRIHRATPSTEPEIQSRRSVAAQAAADDWSSPISQAAPKSDAETAELAEFGANPVRRLELCISITLAFVDVPAITVSVQKPDRRGG